jgi:uncharacterized protein YidB (DUF937 family)
VRRQMAIGVVAAAAVALGAVGVAGPLSGTASPTTALAQTPGGPRQGPPGPMGAGMGAGLRATMQAVAGSLGMTPEDLRQALRGGQSLADVAAAHGVDQAALLQTISGASRTQLDQAVADGRLTRGQADALLNVVQQFGPQMIARTGPAGGPGSLGQQGGPRQGGGPGARGHRGDRGAMLRPVADLLGMTPREIRQARQQGQSLAQIAATKGVDQATLVQTITGALKSRLDAAVAAGRLPQDRADAMYQRAQQQVPQMVARTEAPSAQRGPRGPRPDRAQTDGSQRGPRPEGGRLDGGPRGPRGGAPPAEAPAQ